MTATMGPPPPKTPTDAAAAAEASTSQSSNTTAMGPPPPRIPTAATESSTSEPSNTTAMSPPPPRSPSSAEEPSTSNSSKTEAEMNSSPPRNPNPSASESSEETLEEPGPQLDAGQPPPEDTDSSAANASETIVGKKQEKRNDSVAVVPYTKPDWSGAPCHNFFFEVLKHGAIIDQIDVNKKGAYMFGRVDLCDFVLEHPTISRFHAVLQFKSTGDAYLYDLGSTHGTFVNKKEVNKRVYVDLQVGDVVRFGQSSRLYIFQGPSDLMPMEGDLKSIRNAKMRQEMKDMEASLRRAKIEASHADGISWGMGEDAVEENEDEVDEITWQNYKGQLTEKQEKTRDKVIKRLEKIGHMKKEIDAIRAKDIAQGGLTQGQQTQIARNEQRMSQIMEELENLEETLNESIRESLGARTGWSSRGKKKGVIGDDEEDYISDDDEFYDRTSKKQKSSKNKNGENPSVETADTLLDKKDNLMKEMEEKKRLIMEEEGKKVETNEVAEAGDALDAYMSAVSTQLVLDTKEKLQKELSTLQSELDRILYLLKIADPTGEAARKRESDGQKPKETVKKNPAPDSHNHPSAEKIHKSSPIEEKNQKLAPSLDKTENLKPEVSPVTPIQSKAADVATSKSEPDSATETAEGAATAYTVTKPQWLGAVEERKKQETVKEATVEMQDADQFVDYKDREKILRAEVGPGIEEAAPGLIIRKRKKIDTSKVNEVKNSEESAASEFKAEDAVALLLRHSKGYLVVDEEERGNGEEAAVKKKPERKDAKKAKRVLGPERPSFLEEESDLSTWVPPEGQSGDGRTSLNDRFGY